MITLNLSELATFTPEQVLLTAIIVRAINDAQGDVDEHKRSAINFFNDDNDGVFSFAWCCEQIGVDHEIILKRILKSICL